MKKNKRHFPLGRHAKGHHEHHHKHKKSGWFSEIMGRRAPRIQRGEIRHLILDTLAKKGRHGYDIMQTIQERTGGMYLPSSGTLYPALQILEELELISSSREGKKRIYELTEEGVRELEKQRPLLDDIYEDMGQGQSIEENEFFEDIHDQIMNMSKAITRSFQRGRLDSSKTDKIRKIIHDTLMRVEDILKEE
jgi:DNA-binding PadR family transcriptional regulator